MGHMALRDIHVHVLTTVNIPCNAEGAHGLAKFILWEAITSKNYYYVICVTNNELLF